MPLLEQLDISAEMPMRFTLPSDGGEGEQYSVGLSFCENPMCTCSTVGLICKRGYEADPDDSGRFFHVDVSEKKLLPPLDEIDNYDSDLGRAAVEHFDADDWSTLFEFHRHYKQQITESAPDESLDTYFPVDEIENGGYMVGMLDVLPHAEYRTIELDGRRFVVDEMYCVRSGCDCSEINLGLWDEVEVEAGEVTSEFPVLMLDYKAGRCQIERNGKEEPEYVKRLAATFITPGNSGWFKKRHARLRALYQLYRSRNPQTVTLSPEEKVGRNDPCPCGSGKKYKKCCLPGQA